MAKKVGSLEIEMSANIVRLQQDFAKANAHVSKTTNDIKGHVAQMQRGIEQSMKGISKSFDVLKGMAELGGLVAVGDKLLELGKSAAEYGEQISFASQKTGIGTTELQQLKYAAQMTNVPFEALQKAMVHLSEGMLLAQQGSKEMISVFKAVGVSMADIKSGDLSSVFNKIAESYKNADGNGIKLAATAKLLGARTGTDLIPLLNRGSEGIKGLGAEASRLGIVLDQDAIQKSVELNETLKKLHAQTSAAGISFGADLSPALKAVADSMSEDLQNGGALQMLFKGLAVAVTVFGSMLIGTFKSIEIVVTPFVGLIITLGKVAYDAFHLDWSAIKQDWTDGVNNASARVKGLMADLTALGPKTKEVLDEINGGSVKKAGGSGGSANKGSLSIASISGGSQSMVPKYRAELDQMKDAEGVYHQMSLADEIKFWQEKLGTVKSGTKDYNAIFHEILTLQRQEYQQQAQAAKKASAERLAINLDAVSQEAEQSKVKIRSDQEADRYLLASGQITAQQKLARDIETADREYAIDRDLLLKKVDLYDQDAKEKARIEGEIFKLDQQHSLQIQKNADNTALAVQQSYTNMLQPINSAFDTSIKGIIMGTQTWQQAMKRVFTDIAASFADIGIKMVVQWAGYELSKTMATITGNEARTAANAEGQAQAASINFAAAIQSISASAAKTFAGVWASLSGIPVIGPEMAAAAAPAAMATVMGATSLMSSAGGEWHVPSDRLNMVHKNETILPAHIAGPLRDMVEGGGSKGGDIHIHATDAESVSRLLANNGGALAGALRAHARNFGR